MTPLVVKPYERPVELPRSDSPHELEASQAEYPPPQETNSPPNIRHLWTSGTEYNAVLRRYSTARYRALSGCLSLWCTSRLSPAISAPHQQWYFSSPYPQISRLSKSLGSSRFRVIGTSFASLTKTAKAISAWCDNVRKWSTPDIFNNSLRDIPARVLTSHLAILRKIKHVWVSCLTEWRSSIDQGLQARPTAPW